MAVDSARPASRAQGFLLRNPRLLRYAVLGLTAAIFVTDMSQPPEIALSTLYSIPILFSLWLDRRRFTLGIAGTCVLLSLIHLFHHGGAARPIVVVNCAAAVLTISIASSLGLMRMRAERELRFVRKVALTTLRSLGEAVITTNPQGQVRFVNRAAERLLALRRGDAVGRPVDEVFRLADQHPARPPLLELHESAAEAATEAILLAHHGHRTPIEFTRTSIQSGSGELYGYVLVFRDISARLDHEAAMRRMAFRDELTGLPNRTSLGDRMALELAHAKRNREMLAVLYLDLDGFKEINDRYEHAVGDALLIAVAERLRGALRAGDTVARLGGDEFVVLLPGVSGVADARRVGEKILQALQAPMSCLGHTLTTSASIGVALYPTDAADADTLLRRADKSMYRAKQLGRGRVETHAPDEARAR